MLLEGGLMKWEYDVRKAIFNHKNGVPNQMKFVLTWDTRAQTFEVSWAFSPPKHPPDPPESPPANLMMVWHIPTQGCGSGWQVS